MTPAVSGPETGSGTGRLRPPRSAVWLALLLSVLWAVTGCWAARAGGPAPPEQRGLALPTWQHGGYDAADADAYLRQIAAVGADWVEVVPTWYQADGTASSIGPTSLSPSDQGIERIITLAHARGLHVLLKPHVDMTGQNGRSPFHPDHPAAWFASYQVFITHYAGIATRFRVEEFCVGTELAGVTGDRLDWLTVIRAIRARYPGPLVYAAGNADYTGVAFWDAVDLIGIDVYWSLSHRPTSDPAVLEAAWKPISARLATFAARMHRRVLFTEAGYTSQRGTVTEPGAYMPSGRADQAEQAAAYQALLHEFSGRPWWAGVFWWLWAVLPGESPSSRALGFSAQGKQAAAVLRKWWR